MLEGEKALRAEAARRLADLQRAAARGKFASTSDAAALDAQIKQHSAQARPRPGRRAARGRTPGPSAVASPDLNAAPERPFCLVQSATACGRLRTEHRDAILETLTRRL